LDVRTIAPPDKVSTVLDRLLLRVLSLAVVGAPAAWAGWCGSGAGPLRHQFSFLAGYSPQSATLIGTTTDRRFIMGAFEYSYRCWTSHGVATSFSFNMLPAAILLQPRETSPAHAVYGFGVSPIGFTFEPARRHTFQPFFELRGGIIASAERIPENVTDATALNFLIDFGGGVQWKMAESRALDFGYKFLHISNAFTTPVNPGVDNNIFYIGVSFLR
jgi:hypothetical protein